MELNAHQRMVLAVVCTKPGGLWMAHPSANAQGLIEAGLILLNTETHTYFETPTGRRLWVEEPTCFQGKEVK